MDIDEIVGRDSLEAWLQWQPREVSVRLAHRAAMRVLPLFLKLSNRDSKIDLAILPLLRCHLISGVACIVPTSEIKMAASDAATAAYAAIPSTPSKAHAIAAADAATAAYAAAAAAAIAAVYAIASADAATAAYAAYVAADPTVRKTIWEGIRNDCRVLDGNAAPECWPLWATGINLFVDQWQDVRDTLGEDWAFWRDWYQDALDGVVPDWKMQEEIALIAPEVWDQGPEVVNGVIAEIVEKYEKKNAEVPEGPFYNEDTARGPVSVTHLTENRIVAQMASDGLAAQVSGVIEKYGADTGANQLPEGFRVLMDLPPVLREIARQVKAADGSEAGNAALMDEIKRLNARIERLENDLRIAKEKTLKGVLSKSFAEQAGKSLGDWKMWGALASAAILFSGAPVVAGKVESIGECIQVIFPDAMSPVVSDLARPMNEGAVLKK